MNLYYYYYSMVFEKVFLVSCSEHKPLQCDTIPSLGALISAVALTVGVMNALPSVLAVIIMQVLRDIAVISKQVCK